jgi:hypothetical protein
MQYPPDLKSFCKALAYDHRQVVISLPYSRVYGISYQVIPAKAGIQ